MQVKDRVVARKIIEYCEKIGGLIQRFGTTFEKFREDEAFQLSIGMCIVQIGELTKMFSDEFKAQHSEISWRAIKAMRNIFVHEYEKIDLEQVWKDSRKDVPELKAQLERILATEGENENNDA